MSKRYFGLVALVVIAMQAGSAGAEDANWRDGRDVFQKCKACHSFTKGKNLFGPSLQGVYGRQAGTASDFSYSEGMKTKGAGGLVWNEGAMDKFLTKPSAFIPGTKMYFPGLTKARDRDNVIAYVKRRAAR